MGNTTENYWEIKSRHLLLMVFIAFILGLIISVIFDPFNNEAEIQPLSEALFSYPFYLFLILFFYKFIKPSGISLTSLFGIINFSDVTFRSLILVVPLMGISFFGLYAVFYPLSFWFPDFIQTWILENETVFLWTEGDFYFLSNILTFLELGIITPIWEEIFFRGLLFTSLANKWGIKKAIIITSLFFGILHLEFIGAAIFSLVLSIIYLKTKSLLTPVIIHSLNNIIVYLISIISEIYDHSTVYTLQEFREGWLYGVIGLLISLPWLIYFYKNEVSKKSFSIPYFLNRKTMIK